jgi:hypothetical protein
MALGKVDFGCMSIFVAVLKVSIIVWLLAGALLVCSASRATGGNQQKTLTLSVNLTVRHLQSLNINQVRAYRLFETALKELGYNIELEYMPPQRALQQVHEGYIDGLFLRVAGVEQQHSNIIKVPSVVHSMRVNVYTAKDNLPEINMFRDTVSGNIALLRGVYPPEYYLPEWLLNRDKIWVTSFENGAKMAAADRVVMVALPELVFRSLEVTDVEVTSKLVALDFAFDRIPNYCFLNIKHQNLVPKLANIMERLKSEDPFQYDDSIYPPVLTKDELIHFSVESKR